MSQAQELGLRAQVLDVVPPGPIHRNRRSAVAKFSHRIPSFRDPGSIFSLAPDPRAGAVAELAARKKEETVSRLRAVTQQQQQRSGPDIKVPLLLEQRDAASGGSGPPAVVFKGVPEAGGGANMDGPPLHYVLFRSGNRVTAFPADQWFAFKPHVDRRGLVDSVAAANAAANRQPPSGKDGKDAKAPVDPFALRLVPKSQRMEKQRQEEEARERQEQVAAGRLLPLAGAVVDELRGAGGRLKRFVDEDELEEELFGNDEEDEAPRFGGKAGKGGKKGRSRGLKTADGEELGEDEVPEDLYAGPGADEDLRPEKPEEAEDWEHEFAPDDDDQDQGHDEVYEDDPGMRKKLGIEADDEDEGEEADEQARKLKKLGDPDDSDQEEEEQKKKEDEEAKRQQAAAAAGAGAAAGGDEDEQGDEDEDELDELDEMEEEAKPPPARPPSVPPAASKPPIAPGGAAGAKRKVPEESRPTAEGAKRARTATPPPAAAAAAAAAGGAPPGRPAAPAAATAGGAGQPGAAGPTAGAPQQRSTGAAAAAGGAAAAGAAAGGPAVTSEEVVELLRRQPNGSMPFQDFTRYFAKRTTTPELRASLKSLAVSLCKSSKNEAGQLLVSLKK